MHSSDTTGDLVDTFVSVARLLRRRQVAALEPFGLSPSQSRVMRVLAGAEDSVRLGHLAERLRIAPRSATEVVDSLEAGGYVERRADETDRRAVRLGLTTSGRELFDSVERARRETSARVFETLTAEERNRLRDILLRMDAAAVGD